MLDNLYTRWAASKSGNRYLELPSEDYEVVARPHQFSEMGWNQIYSAADGTKIFQMAPEQPVRKTCQCPHPKASNAAGEIAKTALSEKFKAMPQAERGMLLAAGVAAEYAIVK